MSTAPMSNRHGRARGFTLIELIVVLIIIATIAGLVISNVAFLGRSADMAATAKTQQDCSNQMQMYFVLQKRFPQGMDSLLVSTAAQTAPTAVLTPQVDSTGAQTWGLPSSTIANPHNSGSTAMHGNLSLGTLVNGTPVGTQYARSLTRCGFDYVLDHAAVATVTTLTNCNDSGIYARSVVNPPTAGTIEVAEVAAGSALARRIFPYSEGTPPGGIRLVALGIGARNSAAPTTMLNAPIYPGCDGTYYGRYIAIFAVYPSGERATLVCVCDAYGRVSDYSIQQFNESLPNNGRQG